MNFPPFKIGQSVKAIRAFERKTGLCAMACVDGGEVGEVQYYWSATQRFVVEWPGVRNRPQTVHAAADWDLIVGAAVEQRKE